MISAKFQDATLHIGDTLRIHSKIVEGEKSRIQIFEGILIRLRGRGENATFTVRKIGVSGIGVEKSWLLDARELVKIEVKKKSSGVRRSKLYYLRGLTGKEAVRV